VIGREGFCGCCSAVAVQGDLPGSEEMRGEEVELGSSDLRMKGQQRDCVDGETGGSSPCKAPTADATAQAAKAEGSFQKGEPLGDPPSQAKVRASPKGRPSA
jgi:hypothetical protein